MRHSHWVSRETEGAGRLLVGGISGKSVGENSNKRPILQVERGRQTERKREREREREQEKEMLYIGFIYSLK